MVLKCCSTVVLSCIFYDVISALTTSLLAKWRDINQVCSIFLQFQPCYRFNAFGEYCQMQSFFSNGSDAFSLGPANLGLLIRCFGDGGLEVLNPWFEVFSLSSYIWLSFLSPDIVIISSRC